jgi:hypothetical protein
LEEEFYGNQNDVLYSGLNCEISSKLTLIRRPGLTVYNSQIFPPINRFYEFKPVVNSQETIRVMADVQGTSTSQETLDISAVEVLQTGHYPLYVYYLLVTFTSNIPVIVNSQTYFFSGLTTYTTLNNLTLSPLPAGTYPSTITPTANQAVFSFISYAHSGYGPASDTGTAVVTPASGSPTVRDVTGPNTNTIIWNKNPQASITSFLGVGNTLYFSDGINANKLIESSNVWDPYTTYSSREFIVDTNGNLELNIGSQQATISAIQVVNNVCTLFLSSTTTVSIPGNTKIQLFNLVVPAPYAALGTALSGTTQTIITVQSDVQISFAYTYAAVPYTSVTTGQLSTGTGQTGATQPTWSVVTGGVTQDGGAQWVNAGSQVETWGISTPTVTPTVTQAAAPSTYPAWAPSTWYAPLFIIYDGTNLQKLTQSGTTGTVAPTWNATVGGNTLESGHGGTAIWTNLGSGNWTPSTSYAVGSVVQASFTYYITTTVLTGYDGDFNPIYTTEQVPVTANCLFECTTAGTSSTTTPNWINGLGTTVQEITGVVWTNQSSGVSIPVWPGASQTLSLATKVLDTNNNVQQATVFGESGSGTNPTGGWSSSLGSYTTDNTEVWLNQGSFGAANTGAWIYAYSFENSVSGHIGTASQESSPILVSAGNLAVIQGAGSTDPQVDTIVIWRTVQGGSQLFYLDSIPNPGTTTSAGTWVYTDTTPDTGLNELIEAPIDGVNDPPPTGLLALTYHLGRIWGAVDNLVYFSTGPDVTAGNGNEAWSASNVFAFPDTVTFLYPTTSGLYVFTVSDLFIIQGLGTASSAFFSAPMLQNLGLVSYDAIAINGALVYMYTSDNQIITLDPSSGASEIGVNIGDQFGPELGTGTFNPSSAHVTWHFAGSQDKGLYVSDFNGIWWRMTPTPSPETGVTWSPKAQIVGGFSAVSSVEVVPGTHKLLVGPRTSGPILMRDYTVSTDNGSAYNAWAVLGSIVLAQPGQLAMVESFTIDSIAIGNKPTLAVQLGEIAPYNGMATVAINTSGINYAVGDVVEVVYSFASGGLAQVTSISGGGPTGPVSGLVFLLPGTGYPPGGTGLATLGGTGSGLTVNITNVNYFETLAASVPDPTQLEASKSLYNQRFYVSQTQLPAVCRHLQVLVNWGEDTVKNELLAISLFGGYEAEK